MTVAPIIWTILFFGGTLLALVVLASVSFQAEKRAIAEDQYSEEHSSSEA